MKSRSLLLRSMRRFIEIPKAPESFKRVIDDTKEKMGQYKEDASEFIHRASGSESAGQSSSNPSKPSSKSSPSGYSPADAVESTFYMWMGGAAAVLLVYFYWKHTQKPEVKHIVHEPSHKIETKTTTTESASADKKKT